MKQKINSMKTSVKANKVRVTAILLCFVMLLTAIGAGGVFSAITADRALDKVASDEQTGATGASDVIGATGMANTNPNGADVINTNVQEALLSKKGDFDLAGSGASTYYLLLSYNSNKPNDMTKSVSSSSATFTVSPSSFGKSSWETGVNYYVGISSSTSYTNMYSQGGSSATGTVSGSITAGTQNYNIGSTTYNFAYFTITNTSSVQNVTVSVAGGSNTTYSFSASSNVYSIGYNTPTNGSWTAAPTSGIAGSTVTVKVSPATGYQCSGVTYNDGSAHNMTNASTNTYTFTMPSKNVTAVTATFTKRSYSVSCASKPEYTVTGLPSTAQLGDTVSFTVTGAEGYTITSVSTSPSVTITENGSGGYSFVMPASNVTVSIGYTSSSGFVTVYFKSATAYVYHPILSVNGGSEIAMELDENNLLSYDKYGDKGDHPYSDTGSLRYGWYSATVTGVDVSAPISFRIRGTDTYMDATGSFSMNAGGEIWLACDNLMEGNKLVNVSSLSGTARDFYDTPLNMVDD